MKTNDSDVIRPRTLGLPPTTERALMAKAYENYATAQMLQTRLHNDWRRVRRLFDYDDSHAEVKRALAKATEAAFYLADAKGQYRQAKNVALGAAA